MKTARGIGDVMHQPLICVDSIMQVFDALQVAKDHNIHHLVVTDDGSMRGIVCTCDLRDAALRAPVSSVMHTDVATLGTECTTREAAQLMLSRNVGSVVVTQGSEALGIVTRLDLSTHEDALDLMSQCRCAACGGLQHLRVASDGEYLCVSCLDRAGPDGWFDLGTGD